MTKGVKRNSLQDLNRRLVASKGNIAELRRRRSHLLRAIKAELLLCDDLRRRMDATVVSVKLPSESSIGG
jgi:hypothetical protein